MMTALKLWFSQLEWEKLLYLLLGAAACLLCIMFHEVCHGLCAYALGDDTAKRDGRLSFNPLRHIDWVGLLMLVTVHFGWAKPVPVRTDRLRHPRRDMALVALAGPAGNILLACIMMPLSILVRYHYYLTPGGSEVLYYLDYFLSYCIMLNVGLAIFNLFPIPPLDGSKVLFSCLPPKAYYQLLRYEKYGMLLLVALLMLGVLDGPLNFLADRLTQLIFTLFGQPVLELLI